MRIVRHNAIWCSAILALLVGIALPARSQNCSRNMLRINGPNSYVATPDIPALHLSKGFTIECWAKEDNYYSLSALFDKSDAKQLGYGLFFDTSSTIFGVIQHTNTIRLYSPPLDSLTNWHHYAFVFKPGDSIYLYVDTVEVASKPVTSIDSNADSLRVGMSAARQSFNGDIDEFRVWNVPHSLATIKSSLYQTLGANDSTLVLYYSFDDEVGSNSRIHDFSGHGNDGFMRGVYGDIVPSTAPVQNGSPGYRLAAVEQRIIIPTKRCAPSFDTVIHLRNLGTSTLTVDTVGFRVGRAFSIVPSAPFSLAPGKTDSIRLHFDPSSAGYSNGIYEDTLYASSSFTCAGVIRILLRATYDSVGITSFPSSLDFGPVVQCDLQSGKKNKPVTITNTSATDTLRIIAPQILGSIGIKFDTTFPIVLPPRRSVTIGVSITSLPHGATSAAIAFVLDKCSREALLSVSAKGVIAGFSLPPQVVFRDVPSAIGGITVDTFIVLTNVGDTGTKISKITTTDNSIFVYPPTKAFLGPGDTIQLRIQFHTDACGVTHSTLRAQSLICAAETSSDISINVIPPQPVMVAPIDLGRVCDNALSQLKVINPNDRPVRIDSIAFLHAHAFVADPIQWQLPMTMPAHDTAYIDLQFAPSINGDYNDTALLHMAPCGTGIAFVHAIKGYEGLAFNTRQQLFGRGCSLQPDTEKVIVTNSSSYIDTIYQNGFRGSLKFDVLPFSLPIILRPGDSKTFPVVYHPTMGSLDTAVFSVISREGCVIDSIGLRGSREVAAARWSAPSLEFDTVCPNSLANRSIDLIDLGIDSIDISNVSISDPTFSIVLNPSVIGSSGKFVVQFHPSLEKEYNATLTATINTCSQITLPVHGSGGPTPSIELLDSTPNFGLVAVGDSVVQCIAIVNPSCSTEIIRFDTASLLGSSFHLQSVSHTTIARGDTAYICVAFTPKNYGTLSAQLLVSSDSVSPRSVALHGVGLAADLTVSQHIMDFGYVLIGGSASLSIYDTNRGNAGASQTSLFNDATNYSAAVPNTIGPASADSIHVTFHPASVGYFVDTLRLRWNGHNDSIILRGQGTTSGLQLSSVALDFGKVHVQHDSTRTLLLFAQKDFPTVDSIVSTFPFTISTDAVLPHTILSPLDSIRVIVTYHSLLEQTDNGSLIIYSAGKRFKVDLIGSGVEAHPRLNGKGGYDFGNVRIGDTLQFSLLQIKNEGQYRLFLSPIQQSPIFTVYPDLPSDPIAPDSIRRFIITFRPVRAHRETYVLQFHTSSPDSVPPFVLTGTGIYPEGTGPQFGFSIPPATVSPGDRFQIPVLIYGNTLEKMDADTITFDLRYDPTMLRFYSPARASFGDPTQTQIDDSTIECKIPISKATSGLLVNLQAEALLGPHTSSTIQVIRSDPSYNQFAASDIGTIDEVDCGGTVHGITIAGGYNTSVIAPNPAGDHASIDYTLGLDGTTTIDVYNALGQVVTHLDRGLEKAGTHHLDLDLRSLPAGRYVYRLQSLEYKAEGSFVRVP